MDILLVLLPLVITQEAQRIDYANDTADGSPRTSVLATPKARLCSSRK